MEVNIFVAQYDQRTLYYLRMTRKVKGPPLILFNGKQRTGPTEQSRTGSRVKELLF